MFEEDAGEEDEEGDEGDADGERPGLERQSQLALWQLCVHDAHPRPLLQLRRPPPQHLCTHPLPVASHRPRRLGGGLPMSVRWGRRLRGRASGPGRGARGQQGGRATKKRSSSVERSTRQGNPGICVREPGDTSLQSSPFPFPLL